MFTYVTIDHKETTTLSKQRIIPNKTTNAINPKRRQKERKARTKNRWDEQKTSNKMIDLKLMTSTTLLNVNGLMIPIKNQRCQIRLRRKNKSNPQLHAAYNNVF